MRASTLLLVALCALALVASVSAVPLSLRALSSAAAAPGETYFADVSFTSEQSQIIRVGLKNAMGVSASMQLSVDSPAFVDGSRLVLKASGVPVTFTKRLVKVERGLTSAFFLIPSRPLKGVAGVTLELLPGGPGIKVSNGQSIDSFGPLTLRGAQSAIVETLRTDGPGSAYRPGQQGQLQDVNGRHHAANGRFQSETARNSQGQLFDRRTGRVLPGAVDLSKLYDGLYRANTNTFRITPLGFNRINVEFVGVAGSMHNLHGKFSCAITLDATLHTGKCVIKDECRATLSFVGQKLTASQNANVGCGFPNGLSVQGEYTLDKTAPKP